MSGNEPPGEADAAVSRLSSGMRDIARLDDYRLDDYRPDDHRSRPEGNPDAPSAVPPRDASERKPTPAPEPLWREALGERLRAHRTDRGETLTQTADRAGVSPQYLSEMERGLKEPSSEMIAAVAGALGLSLLDLVGDVARHLVASTGRATSSAPQLLATAA
ncbi:helix-turn-helix protein [Labedella gwakjiensis]|uniref:Helix-turn-helix protein n=2 Tax=Labedella gwakjiensis TaxID=390269 RepID=A0A2P8GZ82_9MICO|nr:helix-turn-helix protein [Labedella gwakjiensis]